MRGRCGGGHRRRHRPCPPRSTSTRSEPPSRSIATRWERTSRATRRVAFARSDDGKRILLRVANGDAVRRVSRLGGGEVVSTLSFGDELDAATFAPDGKVYAVSRKGAPRGKVVAFAPPFDRSSPLLTSFRRATRHRGRRRDRGRALRCGALGRSVAHPAPFAAPETGTARARGEGHPPAKKGGPASRSTPKAPPTPPTTIAARLARACVGGACRFARAPASRASCGSARTSRPRGGPCRTPRWMLYRAGEHRFVPTSLARSFLRDGRHRGRP